MLLFVDAKKLKREKKAALNGQMLDSRNNPRSLIESGNHLLALRNETRAVVVGGWGVLVSLSMK